MVDFMEMERLLRSVEFNNSIGEDIQSEMLE